MDVDGTLTDGKIYMGVDGEEFKAFDIKDGYAIYSLLPEADIIPVVITARKSAIVENRCSELGVKELWQGVHNKFEKLLEILERFSEKDGIKYDLQNVAYVGDDILDLKCMEPIKKAGGFIGCPGDAINEIKSIADYVSYVDAGHGAVRDIVEFLIDNNSYASNEINEHIEYAVDYIQNLDKKSAKNGIYHVNDYFYYTVKEIATLYEKDVKAESHKYHADIQWIVSGKARFKFQERNFEDIMCEYDNETDTQLWKKNDCAIETVLTQGCYTVIKPNQIHIPCMAVDTPEKIKIIVGKVK